MFNIVASPSNTKGILGLSGGGDAAGTKIRTAGQPLPGPLQALLALLALESRQSSPGSPGKAFEFGVDTS